MAGIAKGKPALDAGMAAIGLAILIGHHTHHVFAAHLGLKAATDAAIGAGGDQGMLGQADLDHRFFAQGRGRAGLDTGAARHAFGVHKGLVHARRHLGLKAPALNRQGKCALDLVAGPNAARTGNAFGWIKGEIGIGGIGLGAQMVLALITIAHIAQANLARRILQFAVAIGRAGQAIERMVGNIKLHHPLAQGTQERGLGLDHHARRHWRGAGGRRAISALNLDQTHAARAKGFKAIGGTELWHPNAQIHGRAHDRCTLGHGHFKPINGQADLKFGF